MAFLGYGSESGQVTTDDLTATFEIGDSTSFSMDLEFLRVSSPNGAPETGNMEWDKYRLYELSDDGNIGQATLTNLDTVTINGQTGDGDAAQADGGLTPNRNDWQHDTFSFTLDTTSQAWQSLAVGESLSVIYLVNGTEYLNPNGSATGTSESDSLTITLNFVKTCFGADALIRMADGSAKRAGDVVVGDLVATADHGAQPVRWVGTNTVMAAEMAHFAKWRPVMIRAGALGNGLPEADLLVSQLHRVLVTGAVAEARFGAAEVLVPARALTVLDGVEIVAGMADLTYVHFMFDHHEVVWANGLRSESFYVSPLSRSQIGEAQLAELTGLFPALGAMVRSGQPVPARPFVRGEAALRLATAHKTGGIALQ